MWLPRVAKAADSKPGAYSRQGGLRHVGESHPRTGRLDGALSAFRLPAPAPICAAARSPQPAARAPQSNEISFYISHLNEILFHVAPSIPRTHLALPQTRNTRYNAASLTRPRNTDSGEVAEWSNVPDSKSGVRVTVPWVRIPPSPPVVMKKAPTGSLFYCVRGRREPPMWLPCEIRSLARTRARAARGMWANPTLSASSNRDRGSQHADRPLPHHPACGSAPGGSSS